MGSESDCDVDDSDFFLGMINALDPQNEFEETPAQPTIQQEGGPFYVNTIRSSQWTATLDLNGSDVDFKLDSDVEINVLPMYVYNNLLNRPKIKLTNIKLSAYNNTEIPVLGNVLPRSDTRTQLLQYYLL